MKSLLPRTYIAYGYAKRHHPNQSCHGRLADHVPLRALADGFVMLEGCVVVKMSPTSSLGTAGADVSVQQQIAIAGPSHVLTTSSIEICIASNLVTLGSCQI
jgi:hypothetical protein